MNIESEILNKIANSKNVEEIEALLEELEEVWRQQRQAIREQAEYMNHQSGIVNEANKEEIIGYQKAFMAFPNFNECKKCLGIYNSLMKHAQALEDMRVNFQQLLDENDLLRQEIKQKEAKELGYDVAI